MDHKSPLRIKAKKGQSVVEFTFAIFIVFLFVYAFIRVFEWSGIGLAERGQVHQAAIEQNIVDHWSLNSTGPMKQIDPYYYKSRKMRAVWGE